MTLCTVVLVAFGKHLKLSTAAQLKQNCNGDIQIFVSVRFRYADSYASEYAKDPQTILKHFQKTSDLFQLFCFSFTCADD